MYSIKPNDGWVDFFTAPYKDRQGKNLALILSQNQTEGGEFKHLCLLPITASLRENQPKALTKGQFVVTAIRHWDHVNDLIFYMANSEQHSEELHLYAIKVSKTAAMKPMCVTCKLHFDNNGKFSSRLY